MTSFRERMKQAHIEGERGRALRTAESFRAIMRAQVYHKTANDLEWISVGQLAEWMKKPHNVSPAGSINYYTFILEYEWAFTKLYMHGFLNWGTYKDGRWDFHNAQSKDPRFVLFQLTDAGSSFIKDCPTNRDIIWGMGLWKAFE